MKDYIDLVNLVLNKGKKNTNRTGIDTFVYPIAHFRHDMADGFPLLTSKKMGLQAIAVELEGFIKGITSKRWYQDRGCHIWDQWANPRKVTDSFNQIKFIKAPSPETIFRMTKEIALKENDLGPLYGYQGRQFGMAYDEDCDGLMVKIDQFADIVNKLKTNPTDRRMVCSYWAPHQLTQMALPPCICIWNVDVLDGYINLSWHQRSADVALGVPFDIAHMALLLLLLCKESGYKPGILGAQFHNFHIYENHIDDLIEQVKREPYPLPTVNITGNSSIYDWTHKQLELINYKSHPRIKFNEVAV